MDRPRCQDDLVRRERLARLFVVQYDWINDYIILIIATAGSALFVFYDFVMFRCQRLVNYYVGRIARQ